MKAPTLAIVSTFPILLSASASIGAPGRSAAGAIDGVYKNLQYVEESGDLLGMAVEIHTQPRPTIRVTLCEGGCFGGKVWPLTVEGSTIAFATCEAMRDEKGRPAGCQPIRYTGQFGAERRLVISSQGDAGNTTVLKWVQHPKPGEVEALAKAH
ncbi:hypothetical protein [Sphingomonas elodea]|uniref:hypothetical protein n=1 Tax=Sphingomonas elodea TaxID=179878 RepID=UPI0002E7006F|nr:hypothetical protein [Sphingomonas elodea]